MVEEPPHKPDQKHDGNDEEERHGACERNEKSPVFPGMTSRLAEVALQDQIIAAIRLPSDVEGIAEDRNGSDKNTDADVDCHAQQSDVGNASNPGGDGDDEGEQSGEHVSQTWYEADDAIDTESDPCERDAEGFIEQNFKAMQGLVAKEPCTSRPAAWAHNLALPRRRAGRAEMGRIGVRIRHLGGDLTALGATVSMLQSKIHTAAIVQRQNA